MNIIHIISEDYWYWKEDNFKSLPTSLIGNFREALLKGNAPIDKRTVTKMSTTPAQYTVISKIFELENQKFQNAETLRRIVSKSFLDTDGQSVRPATT